jgi:hypothetical protein
MFPKTGCIARLGFCVFVAVATARLAFLFRKVVVNAYNDRAALLKAPWPHLTRPERESIEERINDEKC